MSEDNTKVENKEYNIAVWQYRMSKSQRESDLQQVCYNSGVDKEFCDMLHARLKQQPIVIVPLKNSLFDGEQTYSVISDSYRDLTIFSEGMRFYATINHDESEYIKMAQGDKVNELSE